MPFIALISPHSIANLADEAASGVCSRISQEVHEKISLTYIFILLY